MDRHMVGFLEETADIITEAPPVNAPADYLAQRAEIVADSIRAVIAGAHPAEALDSMAERLEQAANPTASAVPSSWRTTNRGLVGLVSV